MPARANSLLADLPEGEYQTFVKHLQLVSLEKGKTLFYAGEIPTHVYFPVGAIVSMINDSEDGLSTETFMLGKSCMVGVGTEGQPSFYRAHVRGSGLAYRISMDTFLKIRSECPTYFKIALSATNRMLMQLSQAVVCGKRHSAEQQLIRWMLITLDRTMDETIQITHQELSEILGFRREAITLSLGKMTIRGEIRIRRGSIDVLHREALEQRTCNCYWIGQERKRPSFEELVMNA